MLLICCETYKFSEGVQTYFFVCKTAVLAAFANGRATGTDCISSACQIGL